MVTVLASEVQEAWGIVNQVRVVENGRAFAHLGVTAHRQWSYSDQEPDWDGIESWLRQSYGEVERVWAPAAESGGHEHHNKLAEIAHRVFGDRASYYATYHGSPAIKTVTPYEVSFEPEWVLLKLRALACFESQICGGTGSWRHFAESLREYVSAPES